MPEVIVAFVTLSCLLLISLDAASVSPVGDAVSPHRVRSVLRALLALNDGELQSLMTGEDPKSVAHRISPETELFLEGAYRKLKKLKKSFPDVPGDMDIARRRKLKRKNKQHRSADSLLGAISQLAEHVESKKRNSVEDVPEDFGIKSRNPEKKSINENKLYLKQHHDKCKYHGFHPEFWFRPRECPVAADGTPQLFCPTPNDAGDWACIEQDALCDDVPDCPNAEDELPASCLFYTPMRDQLEDIFFILSHIRYQ